MASALPESIAIAINIDKGECYVSRNEKTGLVLGEIGDLLSPLVKIQVERANVDSDHVHLRFTSSNRYWQKGEGNSNIVAVSKEPDEVKKNPTCTLFKPRVESDVLYLAHAQTGWAVVFDHSRGSLSLDRSGTSAPLRFVDAETLVKLPKYVAFKAVYNGCFLKAEKYTDHARNIFSGISVDYKYFRFNSDERDEVASGYEVFPMDDGHVMIKSDEYGLFWRQDSTWINGNGWMNSNVATANNKDALFWPVKINDKTIALRSAANNMFCRGLSRDSKNDCLNANEPNLGNKETHLEVHERVRMRKIRNVRYRMEDARMYGETPLVQQKVSRENPSDQDQPFTASVDYKDEISYSFTQGLSITTGVSVSMEVELPAINVKGGIEVHRDTNRSVNWGRTKSEAITLTASTTVRVPPKSKVTVTCFATKGTCNIPFSYTQEDHSSVSTDVYRYEQNDGIYEGVSSYNFEFKEAEVVKI